MPQEFRTARELVAAVGKSLGASDWLTVDQQRINHFADATDDHQWIHVDVARAQAGPFQSTIAHGYLTLSLVNALLPQLLRVPTAALALNRGCHKVRFPAPVPSGSRIRGRAEVLSVDEVGGGWWQVVTRFTPDAANNVGVALAEFPPIWINEVLTNNVNGITDSKGEHEPWIELINTGGTPIDLSGWYLTASYASLAGWAFPAGTTVPAGGFLMIFADGETADATASELHSSFRLPASNGTIGLVRPQATGLAVVDYVNYGSVSVDSSMASIPDAQRKWSGG